MRTWSVGTGLACVLACSAAIGQAAPSPKKAASAKPAPVKTYPQAEVRQGAGVFRQNCSFCHGRDAGGGEGGPDLTASKLVSADVNGEKIGIVIKNGRPERGMPKFDLADEEVASLVAFIHTRQALMHGGEGVKLGGRRGVEVADLQTGNAEAGRAYFNGAGGCAKCHSPTGDLAGVASRLKGLELEKQMLYPQRARAKLTVRTKSGQTLSGRLAYQDEFTVGMVGEDGQYRSWRTQDVEYKIDAPANAHVEQFPKYTDDDVHNLMAFLQTLK